MASCLSLPARNKPLSPTRAHPENSQHPRPSFAPFFPRNTNTIYVDWFCEPLQKFPLLASRETRSFSTAKVSNGASRKSATWTHHTHPKSQLAVSFLRVPFLFGGHGLQGKLKDHRSHFRGPGRRPYRRPCRRPYRPWDRLCGAHVRGEGPLRGAPKKKTPRNKKQRRNKNKQKKRKNLDLVVDIIYMGMYVHHVARELHAEPFLRVSLCSETKLPGTRIQTGDLRHFHKLTQCLPAKRMPQKKRREERNTTSCS